MSEIEWIQQGYVYLIQLGALVGALGAIAVFFYKSYHKTVKDPITKSSDKFEKRIRVIEATQEDHESRITHAEKCLDNDNRRFGNIERTCEDTQKAAAMSLRIQIATLNLKLRTEQDPEAREELEHVLEEIHDYLLERL